MASFESLDGVDRVLGVLGERGYARRIPRRPGQKEDRFEHLLGTDAEDGEAAQGVAEPTPDAQGDLAGRVAVLEAQVADLRRELSALSARLVPDQPPSSAP